MNRVWTYPFQKFVAPVYLAVPAYALLIAASVGLYFLGRAITRRRKHVHVARAAAPGAYAAAPLAMLDDASAHQHRDSLLRTVGTGDGEGERGRLPSHVGRGEV